MHINTHSALLDIFAVQMPKARRAEGLNVYAGGLTFHAGVQFPHRQAVRVERQAGDDGYIPLWV